MLIVIKEEIKITFSSSLYKVMLNDDDQLLFPY